MECTWCPHHKYWGSTFQRLFHIFKNHPQIIQKSQLFERPLHMSAWSRMRNKKEACEVLLTCWSISATVLFLKEGPGVLLPSYWHQSWWSGTPVCIDCNYPFVRLNNRHAKIYYGVSYIHEHWLQSISWWLCCPQANVKFLSFQRESTAFLIVFILLRTVCWLLFWYHYSSGLQH